MSTMTHATQHCQRWHCQWYEVVVVLTAKRTVRERVAAVAAARAPLAPTADAPPTTASPVYDNIE
jgi:hypothetical protein